MKMWLPILQIAQPLRCSPHGNVSPTVEHYQVRGRRFSKMQNCAQFPRPRQSLRRPLDRLIIPVRGAGSRALAWVAPILHAMFAELDAHNSAPRHAYSTIPREPGARHSPLNPRDPCRSMLEMPQGDGDETYPHPLPRNSGEWRALVTQYRPRGVRRLRDDDRRGP